MRFFILSLRRNILPFLFVCMAISFVVFSRTNLVAATNGLTLWATCVVPSLFPFFVITNLLSHTKVVTVLGKLLDKIMRPVFNVPGIGGFAFVMGLISGYPVGAKIVSDFREKNLVTQDEGERLLAFTNNSGPLFIISSVGISLFGDTKTGLLLLCTHILACITVGILLGKFSKKSDECFRNAHNAYYNSKSALKPKSTQFSNNNVTFRNLGEILGNSINSSISTILLIGGFVVIFSVIISVLNQTHLLDYCSKLLTPIFNILGFNTDFAKPILSGILELTNGVNLVANIPIKEISQNVILCAFLLGFGGFSVLLQVFSIISKTDLSIKKYLFGKLLQGIFAAFYTFVALKCLPFLNLDFVASSTLPQNSINVLSNTASIIPSFFYDFGIFVIGVLCVLLIFYTFRKLYDKVLN